ncbi:hypothetical protein THAOC_25379, partial [Thalassiosira oceanica]
PRGVVPRAAGVPRARQLQQLHRLPGPRRRGAVRTEEGREGEEDEGGAAERAGVVRALLKLDALRHRTRDMLPPRKLPGGERRPRAGGFAGIYLPLLSGASEGIFMFEPEMTIIHSPKVGGLAAERGTYKKRIRRTKAKNYL